MENYTPDIVKSSSVHPLCVKTLQIQTTMNDNHRVRQLRQSLFQDAFLTSRTSVLSMTNRIPFPMKLFQLLEDIERENCTWIVCWSSDGQSFGVHNNAVFVQEVMPQYFRQTKYKSFQRQLHLYGYCRLPSGQDRGNYCHPMFIKGKRELCHQILPLQKKRPRELSRVEATDDKGLVPATDPTKSFDHQWESDEKLPAMPRLQNPNQSLQTLHHHTGADAGAMMHAPAHPSGIGGSQSTLSNHDSSALAPSLPRRSHPESASFRTTAAMNAIDHPDVHDADEMISRNLFICGLTSSQWGSLQHGYATGIQPLFPTGTTMTPNTVMVNIALNSKDQKPNLSRHGQLVSSRSTLPIPRTSGPQPGAATSGGDSLPNGGEHCNRLQVKYTDRSGPFIHQPILTIPYREAAPLGSTAYPGSEEGNDVVFVSTSSATNHGGIVQGGPTRMTTTHDFPQDFDYSILEPRPFKELR
jgi:hypothetical protein